MSASLTVGREGEEEAGERKEAGRGKGKKGQKRRRKGKEVTLGTLCCLSGPGQRQVPFPYATIALSIRTQEDKVNVWA